MMLLAILGYAVAVSCIATYIYAASGRSLTPNLWANMIGGPIVAFGNALVGYWPAVILEVFFTGAGAYGLLRLALQRKRRDVYDWRLLDSYVLSEADRRAMEYDFNVVPFGEHRRKPTVHEMQMMDYPTWAALERRERRGDDSA